MTATAKNGGYVLGGAATFVPELGAADLVVVVARLEGQPSLFVVDRAHLQTVDEPTLDSTRRLGTAVIDSVAVDSDRLLGGEPCSWPVVEKVTDRATAILAAEMCGGAQKVLDLAVEMLGPRLLLTHGSEMAEDDGAWAYGALINRALTIGGGTSEVQKNIIAERVLGLPRAR